MDAQHAKAMIERGRVIAILRGDYVGLFARIAQVLAEAGVTAMEVTLNSHQAGEGIREMKQTLGNAVLIGAGTVLNETHAMEALRAGAQFIVAPNTNDRVLEFCNENDVCVIPGAYTATEVMNAIELGATMVKLFPAELGYFKAIRAPLNQVPFVVTGGVSLDNAAEFIKAGAVAVGMGSHLIGEYLKKDGGFDELSRRARTLVQSLSVQSVS